MKTVVCSKVHFINSCSIYRLAVLPFTEETIDDISLATGLIVSLLFLSLFPSPTPPLLHLPFLLALFFPVFAFSFFCTWLLSLFFFVFSSLCFFQLQVSQEGFANLFIFHLLVFFVLFPLIFLVLIALFLNILLLLHPGRGFLRFG